MHNVMKLLITMKLLIIVIISLLVTGCFVKDGGRETRLSPAAGLYEKDSAAEEKERDVDLIEIDTGDKPLPSKVPPERYGEDREIMVQKRKYLPKEVWDVAGSPNLEKERVYFLKALEKEPNNPQLLFFLGFNHMEGHLYEEAEEYFRKTLKIQPEHKLAAENLVFTLFQRGKLAETEEMLNKFLQIHQNNPRLLYYTAQLELRVNKNPHRALKLLDGALEKKIEDPSIYKGLAQVYFEIGQIDEGIWLLKKSIEDFPRYPDSYVLLAEKLKDEKGDTLQAVKLLDRIIELVPSHDDSYLLLGDIYLDLENFEEAVKVYGTALEKRPVDPGEIHLQRGKAFLGLKDLDKGEESFRKALEYFVYEEEEEEEDPGGSSKKGEAYLGLSYVYAGRGEYSQALSYISKGEKTGANPLDLALSRWFIYYSQENYKEAEKQLNSYLSSQNISQNEKEKDRVWKIYFNLFITKYALREADQGNEYLNKTLINMPLYMKDIIIQKAQLLKNK